MHAKMALHVFLKWKITHPGCPDSVIADVMSLLLKFIQCASFLSV